ncbi:TPA: hypothetical protein ACT2ER_001786 [Streptococcus suis]
MSKISNQTIGKNILRSLFAQVISLTTSMVINLIIPKFINSYQYVFWQTYVLYASYMGIMHFGLLDGIVLRYSKYDYPELDKRKLSANFWILLVMLVVFGSIGIIIGILFFKQIEEKIIFILVSVSLVTKNLFMFSSNSFQITNRINEYTSLIIRQRLIYGFLATLLIFFKVEYFFWFCLIDIIADLLSFLSTFSANNKIYWYYKKNLAKNIGEVIVNIKSGMSLMVANFSSNFLVGSAKVYIQSYWNPLIFGQVSFGFSITNLFLTFITAISVVFFPSLKRLPEEMLSKFYLKIRDMMTPILLFALWLYYPGCLLLSKWLPTYQQSLNFAGILLPIIIYSTRMSLLTNNYFKAFRFEKKLLFINLSTMFLEIVGLFGIHILLKNVEAVMIWTIIVTMIKSIWSELLISRFLNLNLYVDIIFEIIVVVLFILTNLTLSFFYAFIFYSFLLIIFLIFTRQKLRSSISLLIKF